VRYSLRPALFPYTTLFRSGVIFAFQVLPIVIFIASFFSILYYLGVMQFIVRWMAVGMQKTMGASGAESLNVAASIFMGQTEAPRSEEHTSELQSRVDLVCR